PIGAEDRFLGVLDIIERKAIFYDEEALGTRYRTEDPTPEQLEEIEQARTELLEAIVETDDALLERYLAGDEISVDEIHEAIRTATIQMKIVPVLCGSAFKNNGVQQLLDAIVRYLPAPNDIPDVQGTTPHGEPPPRATMHDGPCSALAFKIQTAPYARQLTCCRGKSGVVRSGDSDLNSRKKKQERVSR